MLAWLFVMTACSNAGAGQASSSQPTPTPLPTPIIPEKPIYTVQSGTVVRTLEFTGRASPLLEQELFFRADGFVSDVLVQIDPATGAGTVLGPVGFDAIYAQGMDFGPDGVLYYNVFHGSAPVVGIASDGEIIGWVVRGC